METPDKFEDQWRNAFEDAEMSPSPAVWDKVELALANSANGKFKRRIIFFKLMAAASVAFALSIGGIGIYREFSLDNSANRISKQDNSTQNIYDLNTDESEEISQSKIELEAKEKSGFSSDDNITKENVNDLVENDNVAKADDKLAQNEVKGHLFNQQEKKTNDGNISTSRDMKTALKAGEKNITNNAVTDIQDQSAQKALAETLLVAERETMVAVSSENGSAMDAPKKLEKLMLKSESFSFADPEIKMVPWYSAVAPKKANNVSTKKLWAGLGMSGGSFDPGGSVSSTTPTAEVATFSLNQDDFALAGDFESPVIGKEEKGRLLNIGINVGAQLTRRWIIQSGVTLIDRTTTNTSNVAENTGMSFRAVNSASELSNSPGINIIDTYEIDNSYRFISIPVQAGYLLIDRKFGLTLLGGVSNDLFINKSVDSDNSGFQEFDSGEGISRYNLSALMGTELGYQLGKHYIIALTPQIRQAINTTTISGEDVRPTFFEVGFRFKYLLK
ncbi:MAG: hypothetical protein AAF843_14300 [Bacteroidota bacterium]